MNSPRYGASTRLHASLSSRRAATLHAATASTAHTTAQPALPALALEMPAEKYDDEDEVGTGLYVLIGCAAVTVVLMYSWIGYTLYQGFKARRKVD